MLGRHCVYTVLLSLVILSAAAKPVVAAERTAAELLPPTTVIYVEVAQPQVLLDTLLEHPLKDKLLSLPQIQAAMDQKQFLDFNAGVAYIESQFGSRWPKILKQALGGSVTLAVDAKSSGAALLVRATDATTHSKIIDMLANLARGDATSKGNPDPIKTAEYRGFKAYEAGGNKFIVFNEWLLVTNKDELGKQIVDAWVEAPEKSLAKETQFAEARAKAPADGSLWGFVNTTAIREAGIAKDLYSGRAENPAAELLVGGILSNLQRTPYITLSVSLQREKIEGKFSAAHDREWVPEERQYYFGPEGKGRAPAPLLADDAILTVSAYRDISGMWVRAGDLFDEKMNEELAKAESTLSTLFGGKDFGEDILGTLQPEVQVVVTRQTFGSDQPTPAIRLPTFALVSDLKDPEKMQPELRRTFQSLIGFLNVVGAMNGQPQLDLDMEKTESSQIVIGRYLNDANAKDPLGLKINYNFSPTIAFAGKRVVISSTEGLARRLVTATAATPSSDTDAVVNTNVALRFDALRDVLADNQAQLVAQNMLKEGQTKEEAETAIRTVLDLVGWFDRASLRLGTTDRELNLSFAVIAKGEAKAP